MAQEHASDVWHPDPSTVSETSLARLMRHFGIEDFDDFYRFSIDEPAKYWDGVNAFCGVVWSKPYGRFMDLSDGPEFPRWFVGGELNWVDTILQRVDDPAAIPDRDKPGSTEGRPAAPPGKTQPCIEADAGIMHANKRVGRPRALPVHSKCLELFCHA